MLLMAAKKRATRKAGARRVRVGERPTAAKKKASKKKAASRAARAAAPQPIAPARKKKVAAKKARPAPAGTAGKGSRSAGADAELENGLAAGAVAPSFELLDQSGDTRSSSELSGQPYVLYFYPKDDTPGCTTEACGFRDALPEFDQLGVRVIGVSPDGVGSHQRFVEKYGLTFPLLSDGEKTLANAYGVWALKKNYGREYMGIVRSTFLVGADGMIHKVWRGVRVNGHAAEVKSAAENLLR
jgi:peroxiredoxin Q/BCP